MLASKREEEVAAKEAADDGLADQKGKPELCLSLCARGVEGRGVNEELIYELDRKRAQFISELVHVCCAASRGTSGG